MEILIILLMLFLIIIGMPVAFAIIVSTFLYFSLSPTILMEVYVQRVISGTQSFPLLAVPFFILTGYIMNQSDISRRLIAFASSVIGHLKGGIGYTSVLVNTMLAGLSGSSNADAAVTAKLFAEPMKKRGYPAGLATAVIATGTLIAPILPPSIALIMYGFVAEVSIGALFMAGILPGLLMMVVFLFTNKYFTVKYNFPKEHENFSGKEFLSTLKEAFLGLLLPIIIIGGIRFGIMTPTEAGAIATVYAVLVGVLIYRKLGWKDLRPVLRGTITLTAAVMMIVAASSAFGWILSLEQIPQSVALWMSGLTENPYLLLLIINVFLLIVGMFIEGTAAIILLTPLLMPLVELYGVDPIHFGIVMVLNMTIGSITPPLGTVMFTASAAANTTVSEFLKHGWPYYVVLIILLMVVTYIPQLSLLLANV